MMESSKIAQKRFDPILMGMKPDFTVKTTNPKKQVELLVGEFKPPKNEGWTCLRRSCLSGQDDEIRLG